MNIFLLLHKPAGITSATMLNKIKKKFQVKIGHAGTLDSFATGLLPVAINKATRALTFIVNDSKKYAFTVQWGIETNTLDPYGSVVNRSSFIPSQKEIEQKLFTFIGNIQQTPPLFSAIKIQGKRASTRHQNNEKIILAPRSISIFSFTLLHHENNETTFLVHCSKGTYVRSLARDLAYSLGTHAFVKKLQRTAFGNFTIEQSVPLETILTTENALKTYGISIPEALSHLPQYFVSEKELKKIQHGASILLKQEQKNVPIILLLQKSNCIGFAKILNNNLLPFILFL